MVSRPLRCGYTPTRSDPVRGVRHTSPIVRDLDLFRNLNDDLLRGDRLLRNSSKRSSEARDLKASQSQRWTSVPSGVCGTHGRGQFRPKDLFRIATTSLCRHRGRGDGHGRNSGQDRDAGRLGRLKAITRLALKVAMVVPADPRLLGRTGRGRWSSVLMPARLGVEQRVLGYPLVLGDGPPFPQERDQRAMFDAVLGHQL